MLARDLRYLREFTQVDSVGIIYVSHRFTLSNFMSMTIKSARQVCEQFHADSADNINVSERSAISARIYPSRFRRYYLC